MPRPHSLDSRHYFLHSCENNRVVHSTGTIKITFSRVEKNDGGIISFSLCKLRVIEACFWRKRNCVCSGVKSVNATVMCLCFCLLKSECNECACVREKRDSKWTYLHVCSIGGKKKVHRVKALCLPKTALFHMPKCFNWLTRVTIYAGA